jgi:hypothetical protein
MTREQSELTLPLILQIIWRVNGRLAIFEALTLEFFVKPPDFPLIPKARRKVRIKL